MEEIYCMIGELDEYKNKYNDEIKYNITRSIRAIHDILYRLQNTYYYNKKIGFVTEYLKNHLCDFANEVMSHNKTKFMMKELNEYYNTFELINDFLITHDEYIIAQYLRQI